MDTYAQRVTKLRDDLGQTQEEFAAAIDVPVRTLQDIESGRVTRPQRKTREKIDAALGALAPGEAAAEWDQELQVFLDLLGAFLWALPAETRSAFIQAEIRRLARWDR